LTAGQASFRAGSGSGWLWGGRWCGNLHQTTKASIVYVTHDQIEAMTLATRIVVLKDGIVQQVGTPDEIYNRPANTFVADFMGVPPMNLVEAEVTPGALRFGETVLPVPALPAAVSGRRSVVVGLRPETFSLGTSLSVQPEMIENTGSDLYVNFRLGTKLVTARLGGRSNPGTDRIGLDVATDTLRFFDVKTGRLVA
jgi:multiple sugar transport system ATP-binding protein